MLCCGFERLSAHMFAVEDFFAGHPAVICSPSLLTDPRAYLCSRSPPYQAHTCSFSRKYRSTREHETLEQRGER